jgi:hypothetical protein
MLPFATVCDDETSSIFRPVIADSFPIPSRFLSGLVMFDVMPKSIECMIVIVVVMFAVDGCFQPPNPGVRCAR